MVRQARSLACTDEQQPLICDRRMIRSRASRRRGTSKSTRCPMSVLVRTSFARRTSAGQPFSTRPSDRLTPRHAPPVSSARGSAVAKHHRVEPDVDPERVRDSAVVRQRVQVPASASPGKPWKRSSQRATSADDSPRNYTSVRFARRRIAASFALRVPVRSRSASPSVSAANVTRSRTASGAVV